MFFLHFLFLTFKRAFRRKGATQYASHFNSQVEYDTENSSEDDLRLLASDRIEQSAVPTCFSWYPPIIKEDFILIANDQVCCLR